MKHDKNIVERRVGVQLLQFGDNQIRSASSVKLVFKRSTLKQIQSKPKRWSSDNASHNKE